MTTIRRGTMPSDFFTIVPNSYARNSALTWAERGLLAWLLSHADGFDITEAAIIEAGPTGRDGVRAMVRGLERAGYLRRHRAPMPTGGSTVEYELTDPRATEKPSVASDGKPVPRPDQGKQDVSAGEPNDGKAVAPSLTEDQEKTKTTSSSKRATRLPENFQPDEKMRAWFVAEQLGQIIDGRIEHEKFCDYFAGAPGVKGRKQDWPATWRNWMRSAAERAARRPGTALAPTSGAPYRPSTTDQKVAQTLELGRRLQQMEESL